ncbi:hypothetical protein RND71_031198 [Anisodus tanguticus]|uniref:Uncharacterized protein n=1 Tax=Anisodus tanguticus TaxID=243964 RepID=A0AAE1UXA6_9SOLA|nr:hypothetical protein RND71_031198 [Anisodus tanguticus]
MGSWPRTSLVMSTTSQESSPPPSHPTTEYLGFTSYPPAYLSREARGRRILTGINFASAASGYSNVTA